MLMVRALIAVLQRALEIRAWHHDECVAAAELEHTFLDLTCGRARDCRSRLFRYPSA